MSKLALIVLFLVIASPAWATTYYLATAAGGGSDSNSGTSPNTPWLTPNHAVNCGDVILAAASTSYSSSNFTIANWGTVTCSSPGVAWLKCVTFDACKITTNATGIYVDKPYWGVQGWEVTMTTNNGAGCFLAGPNYNTQVSVHHIIFANDIANSCFAGGLVAGLSSTGSADYIAIIGSIAYNAAAGNNCYSNIGTYQPYNYDSLPGTHFYIAGNFSYGALNSNPCGGGIPSDGEGINIDSLNVSGGVGIYSGQIVVDNNITVANGGRGVEVEYNSVGSPNATVYLRHNTQWGNSRDPNQVSTWCGDQLIAGAYNVQSLYNLVETGTANGCGNNPVYALQVVNGNGTDQVKNNWAYSIAGNNSGIITSSGFSFGLTNTLGTDPKFANPAAPGAPNCSGFTSVPACMATVIANFTPTNPAAVPYGYQVPSTAQTYDPLFPQWLCNVNLPPGLITMGCLVQSALPVSPTITGVTVK